MLMFNGALPKSSGPRHISKISEYESRGCMQRTLLASISIRKRVAKSSCMILVIPLRSTTSRCLSGTRFTILIAALDYVWLPTIELVAPKLVNDRAKMPVRKCVKGVEGWLANAGIDSASNFFRFVIDTVQP